MVDQKDVSNISLNQIIGGVSSPEILKKGERFTFILYKCNVVKLNKNCK